MKKITLEATKRDVSTSDNATLREEAKIPAVIYGHGIEEAVPVILDRVQFVHTYEAAGTSGLVEVSVDGTTYNTLIQDYQQDPLTDFVTHADLRSVDVTKTVDTTIQLNFIGESRAVKTLGGTLMIQMEELPVSGLPTALVPSIDVDIAVLSTFDDVIFAKDVELPEGVTLGEDVIERVVAGVSAPRKSMEPVSTPNEESSEGSEEGGETGADSEGGDSSADGASAE